MVTARDSETAQDEREQPYRNWDFYQQQEDELSPFKDLIQKDPVVCDHCFVIRYDVISHEWWRGSFGWSDYVRWIPVPERNKPIPADEQTHGLRLACSNCGHRNSKHRPLSKDDVRSFARNISETLDAKEIEHDPDVLMQEVITRNTSENQGKQDSHVFAPAVRAAIRSVVTGRLTRDNIQE